MVDIDRLTEYELCRMFDHTLLKPYASKQDFLKLCEEAGTNHFAMVAINSYPVSLCKEALKGTDVHVGAAISFPLGQMSIRSKCEETQNAIDDGADEIDYVVNVSKVKDGDFQYVKEEMTSLVELAHRNHVLIKVIFENCYLTKDEIVKLSQIAKEVRPDYIKTSTGFGTSGATVEDVKIMKSIVGDDVKVKAAGGIRDWETCREMLLAGAERIGTSSSLKILEGFRSEKNSV